MKKKLIVLLLVAVFLLTQLVVLGACVAKARADFQLPEDFDGDTFYEKEIEITFYHTMSVTTLQPTLEAYIKKFNELYPNITVKHEAIGGYDDVRDQLKTQISADNQPNMAYCYPDHVALYNKAKAVISMDDLIESTVSIKRADGTSEILGLTQAQIDDFIEGYYEEGKSFGDGKMYSLPFSKSTEVLYYNKTFFDANGLEVPTTWEEMYTLCKRIKEIDPNCIPLGYDSEANWFITMCEQYGSGYTSASSDHFLFDNDTNKEFVKEFAKWYSEGLVTTQSIYKSYTSGLFVNVPFNTTTGTIDKSKVGDPCSYMSIGSSAGATHQRPSKVSYKDSTTNRMITKYPFEVGIASIPQVDSNNPKVISQGPNICIFKDNDPYKVVASWLFLKYLTTSIEFQAEFSNVSGYVPVLKSVKDQIDYSKADGGNNISILSAKVCIEQMDYYYTSPAFIGSSTARDQVGNLMVSCITGAYDKDGQYVEGVIEEAFRKALSECKYAARG